MHRFTCGSQMHIWKRKQMSFNTRQEKWLTESNRRGRVSRTASCLLSDSGTEASSLLCTIGGGVWTQTTRLLAARHGHTSTIKTTINTLVSVYPPPRVEASVLQRWTASDCFNQRNGSFYLLQMKKPRLCRGNREPLRQQPPFASSSRTSEAPS